MSTSVDPSDSQARDGIDPRHNALFLGGLLLVLHGFGAVELVDDRPAVAAQAGTARLLIDPNTASADELMLLPGIGPALSSRIVEFRTASERQPAFMAADDLEAVHRIGPITVENLRPFLTFATPGGDARQSEATP